MKVAACCTVALLAWATLQAGQRTGSYRDVGPEEMRLLRLEPAGWRVTLLDPAATALDDRSALAGLIRSFSRFFMRGEFLVGVGETGAGDAALIWHLPGKCQATGVIGFGLTPSADGRYLAFQQFFSRASDDPRPMQVRVFDVDSAKCPPGGRGEHATPALAVEVGNAVDFAAAPGEQEVVSRELRSPLTWISGSLVFVMRDSSNNVLRLYRYEPAARRASWSVVDWQLIVRPTSSQRSDEHPSATVAFASISSASVDGAKGVHMRVAEDYRHRVKWIDMKLPEVKQ